MPISITFYAFIRHPHDGPGTETSAGDCDLQFVHGDEMPVNECLRHFFGGNGGADDLASSDHGATFECEAERLVPRFGRRRQRDDSGGAGDWREVGELWRAARALGTGIGVAFGAAGVGLTLKELGRLAGRMDYAAVSLAIKRFERRLAADAKLRRIVEKTRKAIVECEC